MTKKYFDDWAEKGYEQLVSDFTANEYSVGNKIGIPEDIAVDAEILFAAYSYRNYSGTALVIYERDGKLFEVNGSHCSCNGLDGQWSPEATTWEALRMRAVLSEPYEEGYSDFSRETVAALRELVDSRLESFPVQK